MRIGISASTALVLASITVMVSSLALETNTRPAAARMPEGLLPPCTAGPKGRPVRMKLSTFGAVGVETSTTLTELDSRTFGSPRPGTLTGPRSVARSAPATASALGNPKAGKGSPVALACFGSAPGIA